MPSHQGRRFSTTINTDDAFEEDNGPPDELKAVSSYICWAPEIAPTTGQAHLQAYVFTKRKTTKAALARLVANTFWHGAHFEFSNGTHKQNIDYCKGPWTKDDKHKPLNPRFAEWGDRPPESDETNADRWKRIRTLAREGRLEEIDDGTFVRHYSTLKQIHADNLVERAMESPCGIWIQGPPGTGKSTMARSLGPSFLKTDSKWWDGYSPGLNVIVEDLDKSHANLGPSLKIWADRHPFPAEYKGGIFKEIRPPLLVVTSQFHLEGIWGDDETLQALKRRFSLVQLIPNQAPILTKRITPPPAQVGSLDLLLSSERPSRSQGTTSPASSISFVPGTPQGSVSSLTTTTGTLDMPPNQEIWFGDLLDYE